MSVIAGRYAHSPMAAAFPVIPKSIGAPNPPPGWALDKKNTDQGDGAGQHKLKNDMLPENKDKKTVLRAGEGARTHTPLSTRS